MHHVVLLIHGYGGSPVELNAMAFRLRLAGYETVPVQLPERGLADINQSVAAVDAVVRGLSSPHVLDAIGYSLGGIVLREWLQARGGAFRHLIMLATPNGGVAVKAGPDTAPETRCLQTNACGQLQPMSAFLRGLLPTVPNVQNAPVVLASLNDQLVSPASAFTLNGTVDILVQRICADSRVGHGDFRSDSLVLGIVLRILDGKSPATMTRLDCQRLRSLGQG